MTEMLMPDFTSRKSPFHFTTALNTLIRIGVDLDRVKILAVGEYENYKGEIIYQEPAPGRVITNESRIVLHVGYPSAVDQMPYQFFYGLHTNVARSREWEMQSRELMAPFDAAVIRYTSIARNLILKFNLGVVEYEHLVRFLKLFDYDVFQSGDEMREALLWAALFPSFHYWSANPELMSQFLGLLFEKEFRIIENQRAEFAIPASIRYKLGTVSGRLGRETILGKSFCESDSTYLVEVRGISTSEMRDWMPKGRKRKRLESVLDISMPGYLNRIIRLVSSDKTVHIGKKQRQAFLGYSSRI